MPAKKCKDCGHSLRNNLHGFDQNDAFLDGDKLVHSGSCTYCRVCNPVLDEVLRKLAAKKRGKNEKTT